jgi:hypothetical protein
MRPYEPQTSWSAWAAATPAPIFPGKRYESWDDLDDPAGQDLAAVRPIRDDIERRVRQLIDELALTPTADQRLGR